MPDASPGLNHRPAPRLAFWFTWMLSALLGLGCDRNVEDFQPGEEARPPDLARIFPAKPGEVGSQTGPSTAGGNGRNEGRNDGAADRTALPPTRAEGSAVARAPSAGGGAVSNAAPIEGQIDLAEGLAIGRPEGGVLFVIARPGGAKGGPPLAVLRVPDPEFPLAFKIGPEHVMIPTMRFEGEISLSARLDADGNAMTRGPGDISSSVIESLAPGATDVKVLLSERG